MKLRSKTALVFVLASSGVLILVCTFFYFLYAGHIRRDFFRRLKERAEIAAAVRLEKDELSQRIYEEVVMKHLSTLENEQEFFVRIDSQETANTLLPPEITPAAIQTTIHDGTWQFVKDNIAVLGTIYHDNEGTFLIFVKAENNDGTAAQQQLRLAFLAILILYTGMATVVSNWFAREVITPVTMVIDKMETINTGNLHERIDANRRSKDEIYRMIITFNNMLDRLETSIEAQNQFISNASHELKNPLTSILGELEWALGKVHSEPALRQSLANIQEDARRIQRILMKLLSLAQTTGNHKDDFFTKWRVDELILDISDEFRQNYPARQLILDFQSLPENPNQLLIYANQTLLHIALYNVIDNAFKFSDEKAVVISLNLSRNFFHIRICDKGSGIHPSDLPFIFQPFYRTEQSRHIPGYGIGLSMVKKIIQLHKGEIEVDSKPGIGTTFELKLPRL